MNTLRTAQTPEGRSRFYAVRGEVFTSRELTERNISRLRAQFLGDLGYDVPRPWLSDKEKQVYYRAYENGTRVEEKPWRTEPEVIAHNANKATKLPRRYHLTRQQEADLMAGKILHVVDSLGEFYCGVVATE